MSTVLVYLRHRGHSGDIDLPSFFAFRRAIENSIFLDGPKNTSAKIHIKAMKPVHKIAIVAGGYLLAFLIACAAVALHGALTGEPAAQASSGMSAFGDLVLFVVVFGAVALLPTGAAFFFLLSKKKMPNQSS